MTLQLKSLSAAFLASGCLVIGCLASSAIAGPPEGRDRDRIAERSDRDGRDAREHGARDARSREERETRDARDAAKASERAGEAAARTERDTAEVAAELDEDVAKDLADQLADASSHSGSNSGSGSGDEPASGDLGSATSGTSGSGSSGSTSSGSGSSGSSGSGGSDNSGSGSSNSGSGSSGDDDDDDADDEDSSRRGKSGTERDPANQEFRERELVVLAEDGSLAGRAAALGFVVVDSRPLEAIGSVVLRLRAPEGLTSAGALDLLQRTEPGSASSYNHLFRTSGVMVSAIAAPPLGVLRETGAVGVIDGFASDSVAGWSVNRIASKPAQNGHGEAVTAILLDEMLRRYAATPKRLLLDDVVSAVGQSGAADVAALVVSLDHMSVAKADVINMSLSGPDNPVLARAVARTLAMGPVIVAAGGNGGPAAPPTFPAAYPGVIGVAAVDRNGDPWIYSARGQHIDVAALGEGAPGNGAASDFGTSYAAPRISALIGARQGKSAADNTEAMLFAEARDAGAPGRDPVFGQGVIGMDGAGGEDVRVATRSRIPTGAPRP
jgi:hypothetical protein